ncbi:hypothetical protein TNCV_1226991 [Trichonephila clavipes]|nr:hypothetical protein TNCV_1226991 [Trichonephila clavipes]
MYKNALKEDLIRVVENLDGTVESTDTIVKLKTKIENSSTFESDPDFVKTLIQNCIDERVSRNEREPIDLAKECDIYISSRSGSHKETPITYGYTQDPFKNRSQNFKPKIKENYPQYLEGENKNCFICGDSSHCARDCEKRFKPKESNDHIHNRINVNTLKVESEKQNSDEFSNLQYSAQNFRRNHNIKLMFWRKANGRSYINISLDQHSSSISVRTAISPTLTEEFIIHPSVYSEIEKLGHAKSDVLLSESESSLSADYGVSFPNVSVSNVIENSSYDLPYVKKTLILEMIRVL